MAQLFINMLKIIFTYFFVQYQCIVQEELMVLFTKSEYIFRKYPGIRYLYHTAINYMELVIYSFRKFKVL